MNQRRDQGGWFDFLNQSEKAEIVKLRQQADALDGKRKLLTMKMALIRQRAATRMMRVDIPKKRQRRAT